MDLTSDMVKSLFLQAEPVKFGQNLTLFAIAWWMMKGTIKTHFGSIEEKLERVAKSADKLTERLDKVEEVLFKKG